MQTFYVNAEEAEMKSTGLTDFEMPGRAIRTSILTLFGFALIAVTEIKLFFRGDFELHRLSDHLRRDAGIDEDELERAKVRRASLIR